MEQPDQQIVKDLINNIEQQAPDKQSEVNNDSMESFIEESFGSIKEPIISGLINYSRIYDPSNC